MTASKIHESQTHHHGARCGHMAIEHDGHVDFLDDGHIQHPEGITWTRTRDRNLRDESRYLHASSQLWRP